MTGPTAAPAHWPYLDHRTQAEIGEEERFQRAQSIADLDWISRRRILTDQESRRLERLLKRAA